MQIPATLLAAGIFFALFCNTMRRFLLFVLMSSICLAGHAQVNDMQVEKMMTRRALSCDDIAYNAVCLIPNLYRNNRLDTLHALLNYTERNCGMYEFTFTLDVLLAIKDRNFREAIHNPYKYPNGSAPQQDEEFYKDNIISYLNTYREQADIPAHPGNNFNYIVMAYRDYYGFIKSMASSLATTPGLSSTEKFLLNYYANPNDSTLKNLADSSLHGSKIQSAYADNQKDGGINIAAVSGVWIPTGQLKNLGTHPYLGFLLGGKWRRFTADMNLSISFLNASQAHTTKIYNDSLVTVRDFTGFYFGIDAGYSIAQRKKSELDILGGIAYDGLEVWRDPNANSNNNNSTNNSKYLNSVNLNAGLGYKYYFHTVRDSKKLTRGYLWLQAKYNYVDFHNNGGTPVSGNAITVSVLCGMFGRAHKQYYDQN